jgi:hypothetical protein
MYGRDFLVLVVFDRITTSGVHPILMVSLRPFILITKSLAVTAGLTLHNIFYPGIFLCGELGSRALFVVKRLVFVANSAVRTQDTEFAL